MLIFKVAALVALAFAISSCKKEGGDYNSYLILRGDDGKSRLFLLGEHASYGDCAEMGVYEAENYESEQNVFWTNPEFSYGGHKVSEDWDAYVIEGFVCENDAVMMRNNSEESSD